MAEFTVEEIFEVRGRGPVVTRPTDESKARYAAGERWMTGDLARCAETGQLAQVVGIERHCVAPDHPAYFDGALMLRSIDDEQLELAAGQTWAHVLEGECRREEQLPGFPPGPCGGPVRTGCPFRHHHPECPFPDMYQAPR